MPDLPSRLSPYQGLIPYTENDAGYFFGREKETRLIIANLFASTLTILYGMSGVGKSSVLQAGVIHQLKQRANVKVVLYSNWKGNPLIGLKSLIGEVGGAGEHFEPPLDLGGLIKQTTSRLNCRLIIILDQFEEYFLYHPQVDEFTIQFSRAVMLSGIPVSFLISIREDALAKLDRFEGRIPILFDNYLRLEHLNDAGAKAAIEKPIARFNESYMVGKIPIQIESDLVKEVISQLRTGHISIDKLGLGKGNAQEDFKTIETPYLQLVMVRLWMQEMEAHSSVLRLSTLRKLGGAGKIVRTHLDTVMKRLSSDHQFLASQVFQYLVTPSGMKIALGAGDLSSFTNAPAPVVKALLRRLSEKDVRLLRTVEARDKSEVSYEIFHDVLAAPILEWRERWIARYNLKRRVSLLAILTFLFVAIVWTAIYLIGAYDLQEEMDMTIVLYCILPVLCMGMFFGVVGFLTGVSWAKAR